MQTLDRGISAPQQVVRCHHASLMHQPPRHWPHGFLGICRSGEHPPGPSKVNMNGRATNGRRNVGNLPVGHWRHGGAIIGVRWRG